MRPFFYARMADKHPLDNFASDRDLLLSIGPATVRKCPPEVVAGILAAIAKTADSPALQLKACQTIVQCYKVGAELMGNTDPDDELSDEELARLATRMANKGEGSPDASGDKNGGVSEVRP